MILGKRSRVWSLTRPRCTLLLFVFILFILIIPRGEVSAYERKIEMVPMRDGVCLATDIYILEKGERLPVILMRTPYGKGIGAVAAAIILSKGYAWVVQDTRGRFDSQGKSSSFLDDPLDGYDTVEWIAKQEWSDGRVGTFGISAMGVTQYMMLRTAPPHLKCQYVMAAASSLYHDAIYQGGGFRRSLTLDWLGDNKFPVKVIELLLSNPDYGPLWEKVNLAEGYNQARVPVLHMAGWYDIFLQGMIDAFQGLQKYGGEGAQGRQKLVIGPWTHGGFSSLQGTKQGELRYPANSKYDLFSKVLPWFDECLKGEDKGIMKRPAVEYYVMGDTMDKDAPGNEWRFSDVWPVPAKETPFYFQAEGRLSTSLPAKRDAYLKFTADPANPVPTIGGANLSLPAGPQDQRSVENRDDVLTFTTDLLEEPLEVTGPIKVVLYISTSVPDTDFTAKLTDVYPDGCSMLITDGIIRASHREGFSHRLPLRTEKIYKLSVDLWSTSIIFNKGHRIRVAIAGSNFPRFDINQGNGEFFDFDEGEIAKAMKGGIKEYVRKPDTSPRSRKADNLVYVGKEYPSHILLPVVEK